MPLLKKVDLIQKQSATPLIQPKKSPSKKKVPSIKSLVGLSYYDIEKIIAEEYERRGIIILHFEPTKIKNLKLSTDGRFGLASSEAKKFWQVIIFSPHISKTEFELMSLEDIKKLVYTSENWRFYYNDKNPTADMQMRNISKFIARKLEGELEERKERKHKREIEIEDRKIMEAIEVKRELEENPPLPFSDISNIESKKIVDKIENTPVPAKSASKPAGVSLVKENTNLEKGRVKLNI